MIPKHSEPLFKGGVPTKNKQATQTFKNGKNLLTVEQADPLFEYGMVLNESTLLMDYDELEQSEIMLNIIEGEQLDCLTWLTTRGSHSFFINSGVETNKTKALLACGLTADIKIGSKNSYAIYKYDGKNRMIEWDIEKGGHYQKLPKYFHPIKGVDPGFFGMEEGDGRNQALFNYILTLQSNDFTVEEIKETIKIINKYVLKDPVSDSELETILRDDSFKKQSFFKGTKFLHDKFALYLKRTYHIIRNDENILIYKDGVYEHSIRDIERAMVKEIPSLRNTQRKEVLNHLDLISDNVESGSVNLIPFKNGILNIETGELIPFDPSYVITNKIPWNYDPNAYDELADKTLDKITCNDPEIRAILGELIGSCFYRSSTLAGGRAFILTGERANGKSTFISVLHRILGDQNISALDMKSFNERFSTVRLFKKLANIGDDISEEYNANPSEFKKIVTGDRIEAEQKGQPKFEFNPYCTCVFSANVIPKIRDKTGAAQRRLLIVPFNATFSTDDEDYDPKIKYKLQSQGSIEYFIKLGVKGLKRVLENNQYTKSSRVQKELDDYAERNNPLLSFIKETELEEIENEPVADVYRRYSVYCSENNYHPLAKNEFSKQLQRSMKIESKKKGGVRCFVPIE